MKTLRRVMLCAGVAAVFVSGCAERPGQKKDDKKAEGDKKDGEKADAKDAKKE